MRLRERDPAMNRLVKHMEEHHPALGTMYKFTRIEIIMQETGWSRAEILHMATEADAAGEIVASFSFRGNKWKDKFVAEDLIAVGTISSGWKPHYMRARTV